jgi:hypothetical protein
VRLKGREEEQMRGKEAGFTYYPSIHTEREHHSRCLNKRKSALE